MASYSSKSNSYGFSSKRKRKFSNYLLALTFSSRCSEIFKDLSVFNYAIGNIQDSCFIKLSVKSASTSLFKLPNFATFRMQFPYKNKKNNFSSLSMLLTFRRQFFDRSNFLIFGCSQTQFSGIFLIRLLFNLTSSICAGKSGTSRYLFMPPVNFFRYLSFSIPFMLKLLPEISIQIKFFSLPKFSSLSRFQKERSSTIDET